MKQKRRNFFQYWGNYIGLVISFIIILQVRIFRVLIVEGVVEENYICRLLSSFSCINVIIAIIILILLTGFVMGGIFQGKQKNNRV